MSSFPWYVDASFRRWRPTWPSLSMTSLPWKCPLTIAPPCDAYHSSMSSVSFPAIVFHVFFRPAPALIIRTCHFSWLRYPILRSFVIANKTRLSLPMCCKTSTFVIFDVQDILRILLYTCTLRMLQFLPPLLYLKFMLRSHAARQRKRNIGPYGDAILGLFLMLQRTSSLLWK